MNCILKTPKRVIPPSEMKLNPAENIYNSNFINIYSENKMQSPINF